MGPTLKDFYRTPTSRVKHKLPWLCLSELKKFNSLCVLIIYYVFWSHLTYFWTYLIIEGRHSKCFLAVMKNNVLLTVWYQNKKRKLQQRIKICVPFHVKINRDSVLNYCRISSFFFHWFICFLLKQTRKF